MTTYTQTLEKAAKWASIEFNRLITVEALRSKSRAISVSHPRFFAMAYMHAKNKYSMPQIAHAFGLEDHTSVLHGLRRAHGHDGKGRTAGRKPLWKKDQFVNMVRADDPVIVASATDIEAIGEHNLKFANGAGWVA